MPKLRTRLQQPTPVQQQVELPPNFPSIPQEIVDRFPGAKDWQKKLDDFWTKSVQALQNSQTEAANYNNSRVIFSVDTFQIYAKNGIPQPMFALDATGVKIGDVLVVNTPARKMYIGQGVLADDNTPFYVDALGNFSLGANLVWDPATSTLTITGTIIVTSGSIGGFQIGADYIRDTANSMGLASTITGGDDVRFWAGDTFANRASAPFRVLESGIIVATAAAITGTISGRDTNTIASTIDASGIVVTDLINARINTSVKDILSDFDFGSADYAGALKSGTITWNTATGAITGGSGVAIYRSGLVGANSGVATFSIDAVTGNATFAGTLSAPTGNIGGFTIGADYIRDAANSMGLASTVTGGDDVRFWAGAAFASRATAPFRVTEAGVLVATSATITGAITATSGTIGGFDIGSDYIRDAANSMGLASTVTGGDDVRFWAGAAFASRTTAPFRITESGAGAVGGFTIGASQLLAGVGANQIRIQSSAAPTIAIGESGVSQRHLFGINGLSNQSASGANYFSLLVAGGIGTLTLSNSAVAAEGFNVTSNSLVFLNPAGSVSVVLDGSAGNGLFSGYLGVSTSSMDFRMTSSGAVAILGTVSSNTLQFWTNNIGRMSISSAGAVNIAALAGVGTRNVVADAAGNISAP